MASLAFCGNLAHALSPTTATEQICFVFTGSRQSELESCGCSESQNGGIDREAKIYGDLRAKYPHVLAMEAGGWTDPVLTENERLKTQHLVRALRDMRFDVVNVTPYDLALGTTVPAQLAQAGSGRLLGANLQIRPRAANPPSTAPLPLLSPYALLQIPRKDGRPPIRIGVIGVTHLASLDTIALERSQTMFKQMPQCDVLGVSETLRRYVPEVRKQADLVIVLAAMNRASLPQLMPDLEGVDLIVTTHNVQNSGGLQRLGRIAAANTGYWGRYYVEAIVDFDALNRPVVIRGGLRDVPADGPADPAFTKILDAYREDTKNLQRRIAVALEHSRFAGRNQCILCHQVEYLQWVRTPHNFAFVTLSQKNQHYNPDCLPCHVTGYGETDGFVDLSQTPYLASVQCEACHGPAREHVKVLTAMMKPDSAGQQRKVTSADTYPHLDMGTSLAICAKCHDKEHDPNFNYERDLPLASHKNLGGPFRRARPSGMAATPMMGPTSPPAAIPTKP